MLALARLSDSDVVSVRALDPAGASVVTFKSYKNKKSKALCASEAVAPGRFLITAVDYVN